MLGTHEPLVDGQEGGELIAGSGRIPGSPRPASELVTGGKSRRVLRAQDPLVDWEARWIDECEVQTAPTR